MPVIDLGTAPCKTGSIYPQPWAGQVAGRSSLRLGEAGQLTQFGVNLVTLEPGARSSLRHWHEQEDEFVMVTSGECCLIQDEGETVMQVGDCAAFPAGDGNGHHLVNRTSRPATFLVVGTKAPREVAHYCNVDLRITIENGAATMTHRDGSPLDPARCLPEPDP